MKSVTKQNNKKRWEVFEMAEKKANVNEREKNSNLERELNLQMLLSNYGIRNNLLV